MANVLCCDPDISGTHRRVSVPRSIEVVSSVAHISPLHPLVTIADIWLPMIATRRQRHPFLSITTLKWCMPADPVRSAVFGVNFELG